MAKKKSVENQIAEQYIQSLTYNPLMNALRANDKKNLFQSNVTNYFHKTGFPLFDYFFGSVLNIYDELGKLSRQEPMVGQAAGVFNQFAGDSGTGKTSYVIQSSSNIIRPYQSSNIIHYDCENRLILSRAKNLSQLPIRDFDEGGRYIIKAGMTSLEDIQEMIVRTCEQKMKMEKDITIYTGRMNELGKEIKVLEPTIVIIDSIAQVVPDSLSFTNSKDMDKAVELRSNTAGARDAKTFRGFFKEVLPMCKECNVIINAINHVTVNMSMNAFAGVKKQQNWLGQDDAMPGGKAIYFNSFNLMKMIAKTSGDDIFNIEKDGFDGHVVMCEANKSSSNQSGNTRTGKVFPMVFTYKNGFDSLRSLLWYAKEEGLIIGTKPAYKFRDDDSYSFAWKNVHQEKNEKPIWDSIKKVIIPHLENQLSFVEPVTEEFDERILDY